MTLKYIKYISQYIELNILGVLNQMERNEFTIKKYHLEKKNVFFIVLN